MAIEDLLPRLSYSKCDCAIDYKKDLGIVNGVCPRHIGSVLMVDGIRMEVYQKMLQRNKVDRKPNEIV